MTLIPQEEINEREICWDLPAEGYRACFTQAMPLIASLTKAYSENRIEERLKFYASPSF
jgi:hypothetical protein